MIVAIIIEGFFLELEFCFPVVIYLVRTIEIHTEAVVIFIQVTAILNRLIVFIMIILDTDKTIEFHLAGDTIL